MSHSAWNLCRQVLTESHSEYSQILCPEGRTESLGSTEIVLSLLRCLQPSSVRLEGRTSQGGGDRVERSSSHGVILGSNVHAIERLLQRAGPLPRLDRGLRASLAAWLPHRRTPVFPNRSWAPLGTRV